MRRLLIIIGIFFTVQVYGQDYEHVFVFLNSNPDKEEISAEEEEALQKAHRKNIGQLAEDGKLIVAGPFDGGGGIFILTTGKVAEAEAWLESDPAVRANRWKIELFPIHFTTGGACLAKEPYEMVTYDFTRVSYIKEKDDGKADIWTTIAKQKNILMAGTFPNLSGGVILSSGGEIESLFSKDQNELLSLSYKKIWVAKGSFCK